MRRFILQSIILIFGVSGIACACPGSGSAAANDPVKSHSDMQHGEHGAAVASSQGDDDCCDKCVEFNAVEHDSGSVLTAKFRSFSDDLESDPKESGPLALPWPPETTHTRPPPRLQYRLYRLRTPVTFFDRMLD